LRGCRFVESLEQLGVTRAVVRSQVLWLNPDAAPVGMHDVVRVHTRLGRVGTSSFATVVEVWPADADADADADAGVVLRCVCVMVALGSDGRTQPLSRRAAAAAATSPDPLDALVHASRTLRAQPAAPGVAPQYRLPVLVRYSDEDTNLHVNQANYLRFFGDGLVAAAAAAGESDPTAAWRAGVGACAVVIEYAREAATAPTPYEVVMEPCDAAAAAAAVDGFLVRDKIVYCRVRYYAHLPPAAPTAAAHL
jgi:acyl-CoA thioesterase FadM